MAKLAINGGNKVRTELFPAYRVIDENEQKAVSEVVKSGVLSRFLASWHDDFFGGPQVQILEQEWAEHFGVKHAIAVNSATSGLFCAVGAIGTEPGDEIICSPYTMAASSIAPLIYNAIPVFADIEEDYFCMSVESVEAQITPQTKAIIIVDIFGQTYDMEQINALAQKHGLYVIEDCAQAPDGLYKGQKSGTLGDIGIYSLNYHKHIHSGEGGMIVTDNDELADKLKLIRNHAESVLDGRGEDYSTAQLVNMIGYNYRMTEIEAAITRQQLKKLPSLVNQRIKNVEYLSEKLNQIPCIEAAKVRPDTKHCFYIHVLKYDSSEAGGIHRNVFVDAVKAELAPIELRETEGVKVVSGYVKPIYLQPLFQNKIAYGASHFPWSYEGYKGNVDYSKGICPVTERMHFKELINHELMRPGMTKKDLNDVANTFIKVYENRNELR